MADLVIDATLVRLVRADAEDLFTAPVGEAGTAGQYFRLNTTTGKLEKGNGTSAAELGSLAGVLIESVATVNLTGTIALLDSNAILDLGEALAALAFDDPVYVSDTDATLASAAADATVDRIVGRVIPGWASGGTADKLFALRSL